MEMGPVGGTHTFDVVVVGAGIIGLTIARHFLLRSRLSVAVVDAAVPCSGSTGAGMGLLWMAHKTPGTAGWDLALRSQKLWQSLADNLQNKGIDPSQALGWKKAGSLVIGSTEAELEELKRQVELLTAAGLRAEYLSAEDLALREPGLRVGWESGAVFLSDDCQLDARHTVAFLEQGNRLFALQGRYAEFYHDPAVSLIRSNENGAVEGIKTKKNTLYGRKAVIIATGCWTGTLMQDLLRESDIRLNIPVQPRKGCPLVLENFNSLRLNHGLMEAGYINHQNYVISEHEEVNREEALSISMTAITDAFGNLVLGSSRQFAGFNTKLDMQIVNRIWECARKFFPALKEISREDLNEKMNVRIGLRPYMPDGKPVIGPVPGMPNLFLAAGHEGEGLSMALGTAELVVDMIMGNPLQVDPKHFAIKGSLVIGTTEAELGQLKRQVKRLNAAGLRVEYLSCNDLALREPELGVGRESGAVFLSNDCQLDVHRTEAFIEQGNRLFASQGRYAEFYHDPALSLIRSSEKGVVEGIKTKKNTLYGRKFIIIAAGCRTGGLMQDILCESDIRVNVPVKPRKDYFME